MRTINQEHLRDKLFIQEIINDLHKNGFRRQGKAYDMLNDWSRELGLKSGAKQQIKKLIKELT